MKRKACLLDYILPKIGDRIFAKQIHSNFCDLLGKRPEYKQVSNEIIGHKAAGSVGSGIARKRIEYQGIYVVRVAY